MFNRLFPSDKNHILMEVQASTKDVLTQFIVDYVKDFYHKFYNPLGLIDDTIIRIKNADHFPEEAFDDFYHDMAAIYRYKHGEVQLEFLFDGRSHYDKYMEEWNDYFRRSIRYFCFNRVFVRAVLDIAVFHNSAHTALLAGGRLKQFVQSYFNLKVYKYKGILERKAS